jgi:hypothetical protein
MKRLAFVVVASIVCDNPLVAQSVARSVTAAEGLVQVVFPVRANVCGDGVSFIQTSNGRNRNQIHASGTTYGWSDGWRDRPCRPGPGRVLATVEAGQVTRISTYVGPLPRTGEETRTINASAVDAVVWLTELAQRGTAKVASNAIQAMTFADAPTPWPTVLRIARDTDRPRDVRRSATTWLSFGVNEKLGLADVDEHATDDDELRAQAVFVLSQRPKSESIPELIDLARTAKNATVRKSAIFWLGQSGDPRAVDVYAELLGLR